MQQDPVQVYYKRFLKAVHNLPSDQTYPMNIVQTFFANLDNSIQKGMQADNFTIPVRPPNETNHAAKQHLEDV